MELPDLVEVEPLGLLVLQIRVAVAADMVVLAVQVQLLLLGINRRII
jgi:hypothetical protein